MGGTSNGRYVIVSNAKLLWSYFIPSHFSHAFVSLPINYIRTKLLFKSIKWPIKIFTPQQSILFMELEAMEINSIPLKAPRQQNAFNFCKCNLTAHKYIHSYAVLILSGNYRLSLCTVIPLSVLAVGWGGLWHAASTTGFLAITDVPLSFPTFRYRFTIVEQSNECCVALNFQGPGGEKICQNGSSAEIQAWYTWHDFVHTSEISPHSRPAATDANFSPVTSSHRDGRSYFR